jgi:hypothetical protein
MMPIVFGHEELAAVDRIVIAVRANFSAFNPWGSVGTLARVGKVLRSRALAAREEVRDRDGHEIAAVHRTLAGILPDDRGVVAAGERRFDADRLQHHVAFAAIARLVFEDVFIARHRADIRDRHLWLGGLCRFGLCCGRLGLCCRGDRAGCGGQKHSGAESESHRSILLKL